MEILDNRLRLEFIEASILRTRFIRSIQFLVLSGILMGYMILLPPDIVFL